MKPAVFFLLFSAFFCFFSLSLFFPAFFAFFCLFFQLSSFLLSFFH